MGRNAIRTIFLWTVALIAALGLSASAESLKWHKAKSLPAKPGGTLKEGNTVLVRSRASHRTIGYRNCRGTIALKVPPGMALDLHSGSGDCRIAGETAGMAATCDTGSGDITIWKGT
ncbi:MAG: hypothetical protein WBS54_02960 [Acidobacteriota bacterium]